MGTRDAEDRMSDARQDRGVMTEPAKRTDQVGGDGVRLRVRCFGTFEVFGKDGAVRFRRSLSKEAFAYLVHRKGENCRISEICSVLWEGRTIDKNRKSQCRVMMAALRRDLAAAGAGNVLVKGWKTWAVDTAKISCDYYDYLNGDDAAAGSYSGEYMTQYSWAEMKE